MQLPRCVVSVPYDVAFFDLVCFVDASATAYAAVIYLRQTMKNGAMKSNLILCKVRLAPRGLSIPRLELLGLLIGVRAVNFVRQQLKLSIRDCMVLCDSQCVLFWLKSGKQLTTFVQNRISEIRSFENMMFRFINSELNIADYATRTFPVPLEETWFSGPEFLTQPVDEWPVNEFPTISSNELKLAESEMKTSEFMPFESHLLSADSIYINMSDISLDRYCSFIRLLRVTCTVLRAVKVFRTGSTLENKKNIHADEMEDARVMWIKHIQREAFDSDMLRARHGRSWYFEMYW